MLGKHFRYPAIIAAMACSILALAKPKDKESTSEVKFTSRTELVLIPVLVTDKSGAHVSGLKREDFTVLEDGAERKIATFEETTSDARRLSRPQNPNEFSNTFMGGVSMGRITLLMLDFINTSFADQEEARRELLKYLSQSVDQREPTALYTLNRSGVHVIHDFTTDPRILAAALHKVNTETLHVVDAEADVEFMAGTASPDGIAGVSPGAVLSEVEKIRIMLEDTELNIQSFQQKLAITYTLEAMQQIAQALAGVPGRKSLIWASGGFPFSVTDPSTLIVPAGSLSSPSRSTRSDVLLRSGPVGRANLIDVLGMYEHTWQLLNAAQIALYPVDVKGLRAVSLPSAAVGNPGRNYARNMEQTQADTQATFQTFAYMTGGRAYFNSNDLVKGFRDAVSDSAEYYMLGYYLNRANTKSGWRKLAVKVKRPHVDVRSRSGFFVTKTTIDPDAGRDNDLVLALQSPLDYTSLPVVARWGKIGPSKEPGKKHINYGMHLAADASLVNKADNNHLALELLALAKTPEGKQAGQPVNKKVDAHLNPESVVANREEGIDLTGGMDLAPGEYTVRFVVRDDLSGRIGSVSAPLKVE